MPLFKRRKIKRDYIKEIDQLKEENKKLSDDCEYLHSTNDQLGEANFQLSNILEKTKRRNTLLLMLLFLGLSVSFALSANFIIKNRKLQRVAVCIDDALEEPWVLECPSCGSHNCHLNADYDWRGRNFEAHCDSCGLSTYGYKDVESITNEWGKLGE